MRSSRSIASVERAIARPRSFSTYNLPLTGSIRSQLPRVHVSSAAAASSGSRLPLSPRAWQRQPLQTRQCARYASSDAGSSLKKTPMYDLHVAAKGKMVPFAGYSMPVQYGDIGVGESHRWTREKASLFDVGHMVQHCFSGPGAAGLLLKLTPASINTLLPHRSTLSTFLHENTGGIVDDTVITRLGPESFYIVTNAACRDKDLPYLSSHIQQWHEAGGAKVDWEVLDNWGLLALQGPLSQDILSLLLANPTNEEANLSTLTFSQSRFLQFNLPGSPEPTIPIHVARAGYTGEDGFEISLPPSLAVPFTTALLDAATPSRLQWAGLGARDSLRLEAGMCLYGHDLDDTTTPVEGALAWIIGKDRRSATTGPDAFLGADVILQQLLPAKQGGGVRRRRVGFVVDGAPAREGAEIVDSESGDVLGHVTSGCPAPSLGKNIAMGYVKQGFHKSGTEVQIVVRGKKRRAVVTKMPFVETKYFRG
ncbi:MAG: hypothetical protein M1819_003395 [Sarea resinae]|nr:MAG: hypothetical protein M1819_003395 [Sarea resinae]